MAYIIHGRVYQTALTTRFLCLCGSEPPKAASGDAAATPRTAAGFRDTVYAAADTLFAGMSRLYSTVERGVAQRHPDDKPPRVCAARGS